LVVEDGDLRIVWVLLSEDVSLSNEGPYSRRKVGDLFFVETCWDGVFGGGCEDFPKE
jgi:hypothetical protein